MGPCFIDDIDPDSFRECIILLKKAVKQVFRCLKFYISPSLHKNLYENVTLTKENVSQKYFDILKELNIIKLNGNYQNNPLVNLHAMYAKNIKGLTYDEILNSLDSNFKKHIKKSVKNGVKVKFLTYEDLDRFSKLEQENMDEIGYEHYLPLSFYQSLFKYFGENIRLVCAYINCDETLNNFENQISEINKNQDKLTEKHKTDLTNKKYINATNDNQNILNSYYSSMDKIKGLKEKYGNIIETDYTIQAILQKEIISLVYCRKKDTMFLHGSNAIHAHMLKYASEHNISYYNLYGCSGNLTEAASDYKSLKFKQNFKGNFEEYIGTFQVF